MLGVDGSTNVFVKKGDIDIQVSKVGSIFYFNEKPVLVFIMI